MAQQIDALLAFQEVRKAKSTEEFAKFVHTDTVNQLH